MPPRHSGRLRHLALAACITAFCVPIVLVAVDFVYPMACPPAAVRACP